MPLEQPMDQAARGRSVQVPTHLLAREFGKLYCREEANRLIVEFTIWIAELEGAQAERWQTGVALDASASMKDWYGRNLRGAIPQAAMTEYQNKGWILSNIEEGRSVFNFKPEAYEDALKRGFVSFTDNLVQPLARDVIAYLAQEMDAGGKTSVIYWACGDGSAYEVLGDYTSDQCEQLKLEGPRSVTFGRQTHLTPAVRYFVERFPDAGQGMYVFLTDGQLDDLDDLKRYTTTLAKKIESGQRSPVKCVLIGVGEAINEKQMTELDDLETGTDVDIWDHKIAREMRDVREIIVELVDENKIVAPTAIVYDSDGQVAHRFSDGLPARGAFPLPLHSTFFELEVAGQRVRQELPSRKAP